MGPQRSVLFLMMSAVNLYPDKNIIIRRSSNNGIYCELLPKGDLTAEMVDNIREKMLNGK